MNIFFSASIFGVVTFLVLCNVSAGKELIISSPSDLTVENLKEVEPTDTLIFHSGTFQFNEDLKTEFVKACEKKDVTIKSKTQHGAVFDYRSGNSFVQELKIQGNGLTLENFWFRNCVITMTGENIMIKNNKFDGLRTGIRDMY